MSRLVLPVMIGLVVLLSFLFAIKAISGQQEMNNNLDKDFAIQNNCITHYTENIGGYSNRFFICENELLYSKLDTKLEALRENIGSIKIRTYSYVSTNLIGTKSNVNSNAILISDKDGNKIFEMLNIDNEILLRNIKESFKKYGYAFSLE